MLKTADFSKEAVLLETKCPAALAPQIRKLLLVAIISIGALLRLQHLGAKSFWVDEAFSAVLASAQWHDFWQQVRTAELNMLSYYLILRFWIHFGNTEAWLRLLSALFGVATIPIVYRLGSRLFNSQIGLLSAALLAVHPGHITFSQEARSYSMTVFLLAIVGLLLVKAIIYCNKFYWATYAVVASLAIYSHFFAVLALGSQLLGLRVRRFRQHLRAAAIPFVAFVLFIIPVAVFAINHNVGQLSGIRHPGLQHVIRVLFLLTGNGVRCVLYLFLWAIAALHSFRGTRNMEVRESRIYSPYSFLLTWLFAPLLITVLLSFWEPALLPRYLLISLPAAVILAASGIVRLPKKLAALVFVLLTAFSLKSVISHYHRPKQDWRSAIEYVINHSRPADVVAILPASSAVVFDYYGVLRNANGPELRRLSGTTNTPAGQHIWVVTISRPLEIRPKSRKAKRWREADDELEELLTALQGSYTSTEAYNSYGVRVLLISRVGDAG